MNTLKTFTTLALLLLASLTLSAQNTGFSKSVGNNDMGADIGFYAHKFNGNHPHYTNYFGAFASFDARGKVFGHNVSILEVRAGSERYQNSAFLIIRDHGMYQALKNAGLSDQQISQMFPQVLTYHPMGSFDDVGIKLAIGGLDLVPSWSRRWSRTESLALAGIAKKFGVGPFSVRLNAGLTASVTPTLEATLETGTLTAGAKAGASARVTAGVSGGISAGGAAGLSVDANVTLVKLGSTLEAAVSVNSWRNGLTLRITAEAIRILIKLRAWLGPVKGSLTVVDRALASWSHTF